MPQDLPNPDDPEQLAAAFDVNLGGGQGSPPGDPPPAPGSVDPSPAPTPPVDSSPTPAPSPAPAAGGSSIREFLSSRNYDVSRFESDQDAMEAMLATAEALHEARPMIEAGRRYAPHAADLDRFLAEQLQSQPGAPAPESSRAAVPPAVPPATPAGTSSTAPESLEWKPPEFDPTWASRTRWDAEAGRYVPATQYDSPAVADKMNGFREWQDSASRDILLRFPELVQQAVAPQLHETQQTIEQRVQELVGQAMARYTAEQETAQYFQQREADLFELDEQGRQKLDPQTGEPALSPKGQVFREYAEQGRSFGIADPSQLRAYVDSQLARDEQAGRFGQPAAADGNGAPPAPATPAQVGAQKKGQFLERVVRGQQLAQRGGTIPASTVPAGTQQSPDETIDDIFSDEMRKQGLLSPTG